MELLLVEHELIGCELLHCRLIYGGEPLSELHMVGCHISDCQFTLVGAAAQTMQFLSSMYNQSPKMDDPLKVLIEHMFIGVRTGNVFRTSP